MQLDFHGMKESTQIGVILHELTLSLWEDKCNGFNIHGEGNVMIWGRFDASQWLWDPKGKFNLIINDVGLFWVELCGMGRVKDFAKVDVFPSHNIKPFTRWKWGTSWCGQDVSDNALWVSRNIVKLLVGFSDIQWKRGKHFCSPLQPGKFTGVDDFSLFGRGQAILLILSQL